MSSLGGRLRQVVTYESLKHIESKFCLISIRWLKMLYSCEKSILRKKLVFPFEKFPSLVLSRNAIMLQHLIIQFLFNYLSTSYLLEVKDKKISNFQRKSGCGCLREVSNIVICLGKFWYFGKLVAEERWSKLTRDGCNRAFNCNIL